MAFITNVAGPIICGLEYLAPIGLLGLRLWVANVFWKSGVNKFQSWDTTLLLFEHEYQVPILDVHTAALLATGTELIFPLMLAIGLGGRFAALVLFVFNIIAVISYPSLNPAGIEDHQVWGLMLAVLVFYGPGKISVDDLIRRKFMG
ncbi:MAG: DoxX family protein [Gammaproteobacteria bacterium]|nr:DoxX family protein [Gammaproteobacteria bacterium]